MKEFFAFRQKIVAWWSLEHMTGSFENIWKLYTVHLGFLFSQRRRTCKNITNTG